MHNTTLNTRFQGYGTEMLKFCVKLAETDNVDAYLETCGERNLGFYAAKGGFMDKGAEVLKRKNFRDFDIGGGLHCMVRPAPGDFLPP